MGVSISGDRRDSVPDDYYRGGTSGSMYVYDPRNDRVRFSKNKQKRGGRPQPLNLSGHSPGLGCSIRTVVVSVYFAYKSARTALECQ